tara:strand:+ start:950 stop:1246 length:297 start_codon:yes stop_codon:yes gene_type:complete
VEPSAIVEMGSTGALVAVVLAAFKALESRNAKRNGGTVYTRVVLLEEKVKELTDEAESLRKKLHDFHKEWCEWREEMRVSMAVREAKRQLREELKKHG